MLEVWGWEINCFFFPIFNMVLFFRRLGLKDPKDGIKYGLGGSVRCVSSS